MRLIEEREFLTEAESDAKAGQLYRLVDPSDAPELRLTDDARQSAGLINNPFLAQRPSQRLYLYPTAGDGDRDIAAQLIEEKNRRPASLLEPVPFCGWITTRQARTTVAGYLGKRLAPVTPDQKPALLRFYDPRVLEHLTRILLPWQMSALLGPIDRWVYLDMEGRLRCLEPHVDQRRLGDLKLTAEQWCAIRRIGQVNRCRELYRTLPGSAGRQKASPSDVDALVVAAQEAGLRERQDTATFVLHGLMTHSDFYRHPIMQALFKRLDARTNYIGLSNRLSDDDWEAITDMRETT
ncbi:DUF4123 domain-containing protein [Salinicola rhizosphaerae]|uniref:DUF4123 domain-containing protein n=1 Tax=Salinicola rhizosphaerae TaxID=1443141 RepID=A0ABQ3EDL3_9GAMM|nr:DUF4123 domain-containing protein [Salinicola rhizosphaerae]GHB31351.1 hypothetical protein GCM10009038_32810 [Salinicola rhizosphaerae]